MKTCKRIRETKLRNSVEINKPQYGFMPGKGTTDAMFALRMLIEKYKEGQRELHCVFVDYCTKSLPQVSRTKAVLLHEKIRNGKKVIATCTRYIRGKRSSGEMCSRNYKKF